MTQALSAEEKARLKKQWTELAIKLAQEGQWEEAINTNKGILTIFPLESDALNRLGKAFSELGQYTEARQSYSQSLKINPANSIAKRNLDRLVALPETPARSSGMSGVDRLDPRLFIEETGKTGLTNLINLAPSQILVRANVGDRVNLHIDGHRLLVRNAAGDDIGQVEPRLANRLINYGQGGNRYAAAIVVLEQALVRLIIREEYQHPSMFGKVSFPAQGGSDKETIRAYTKDSMVRYDRDDDDDAGNDDEYYDGGDDGDEMAEVEFDGNPEAEE